jgi:hypothetical protein
VEAYIEDVSVRKTFRNWKDITVRILWTYMYVHVLPTVAAARSKAWVCGPRFLELRARILPGADIFSLESAVCSHLEVSGTGRSLLKISPIVVFMSVIVKP